MPTSAVAVRRKVPRDLPLDLPLGPAVGPDAVRRGIRNKCWKIRIREIGVVE